MLKEAIIKRTKSVTRTCLYIRNKNI